MFKHDDISTTTPATRCGRKLKTCLASFFTGLLLTSGAQAAEAPQLNLYSWSGYFAPDTLARFERETGIHVKLDVYDSDETLQTKLLAGHSGYDVVWPSNDFLSQQIRAGVYRPLDKTLLPRYRGLTPSLAHLFAKADPGSRYSVPYMWGTVGVGYDRARVARLLGGRLPANSLDLAFKPEIAARLQEGGCAVGLQDAASAILPLALRYLGRDVDAATPQDYRDAEAMLARARPHIALFVDSPEAAELASGELCVFVGYSGAIRLAAQTARARDARRDIVYALPSSGALAWFDSMAMPKDAPHPGNAHRFINFILRPDVLAAIARATHYTAAAQQDGPPPLTAPQMQVLFVPAAQALGDLRLETQAWHRFKSGIAP